MALVVRAVEKCNCNACVRKCSIGDVLLKEVSLPTPEIVNVCFYAVFASVKYRHDYTTFTIG